MRLLPLMIVLTTLTTARAGVYLSITRPASSGPSARDQAAAEARRQIEAAQAEYRRAFAKLVADHPMGYELRQARLAVARAHGRLNDARSAVVAELRAKPEYRRLDMTISEREQTLGNEKEAEKRARIAEELLALRGRRTEMESAALSESSEITLARAGVQSAMNDLAGVEKMYRWELVQSDQLSAARSRLDSAREQLASMGD